MKPFLDEREKIGRKSQFVDHQGNEREREREREREKNKERN